MEEEEEEVMPSGCFPVSSGQSKKRDKKVSLDWGEPAARDLELPPTPSDRAADPNT